MNKTRITIIVSEPQISLTTNFFIDKIKSANAFFENITLSKQSAVQNGFEIGVLTSSNKNNINNIEYEIIINPDRIHLFHNNNKTEIKDIKKIIKDLFDIGIFNRIGVEISNNYNETILSDYDSVVAQKIEKTSYEDIKLNKITLLEKRDGKWILKKEINNETPINKIECERIIEEFIKTLEG